jgi:hypothetical protein
MEEDAAADVPEVWELEEPVEIVLEGASWVVEVEDPVIGIVEELEGLEGLEELGREDCVVEED